MPLKALFSAKMFHAFPQLSTAKDLESLCMKLYKKMKIQPQIKANNDQSFLQILIFP